MDINLSRNAINVWWFFSVLLKLRIYEHRTVAKSCKTIYDVLPNKQKIATFYPSAVVMHFSSVVNFYDPLVASISPFLKVAVYRFMKDCKILKHLKNVWLAFFTVLNLHKTLLTFRGVFFFFLKVKTIKLTWNY